MSDEMSHPVTRGELRAELANYPTKRYVDDMAKTFVDALVRLETRTDQKFEKVYAVIAQLSVDMTRNMNVMVETIRADIRAITEPYQDHGPRIEKLERAVFPADGGGIRAKARVRRRTRSR